MAYPISKLIIPPMCKLWTKEIKGLENIPTNKQFIIAANHASYYDTLLIPSIIIPKTNKKLHAWVNNTYWKNPITGFFLDIWGGIPVYLRKERDSKGKNTSAFKSALKYLKDGDIMMIFPEGGRSYDGKLQKAYTGIGRLALKSKVQVVPIGIIGASEVLPKGKTFPRFARCKVNIGKPMVFKDKANENNATRKIMKEIAKLTGQKYNY